MEWHVNKADNSSECAFARRSSFPSRGESRTETLWKRVYRKWIWADWDAFWINEINASELDTGAQDRQRLLTFSKIRRDTPAVNAHRYPTKYILMRVIARVMHC
jgi:hypothetical protein